MTAVETRVAALAAAAAAGLYLAFPSARYNFDGVACAIAVELGDFKHLAHGNHLAYGLLGWAWFSAWKTLGYAGPALQCLQVLSSLLGAAAVGAFALLLTRSGASPSLAAAAAAGLMVSDVYWSWALEAQVYPLGCLWLFLAAGEAAREKPRPVLLGLWHAGAILGHVGHAMFFPAACWALVGERERGRLERLSVYAGVLAAAVTLAYGAAGLAFIRPKTRADAAAWLLGSAALNVQRRFQWVGGYPLTGLPMWSGVTLRLFGAGPGFGLAALALAAAGARAEWMENCRRARFLLAWLGGYLLLFTSWHPGQSAYRVSDLAPLWILMAFGARELARRAGSGSAPGMAAAGLAGAAIFLGAWNFARTVLPSDDPGRNADLARALWIGRTTPENAWIVVDGVDQVYVPYFSRRRPLNVHYYEGRQAELSARVESLVRSGEPVFAVPQALGPPWRDWLAARRPLDAGRLGDLSLERLPASPENPVRSRKVLK